MKEQVISSRGSRRAAAPARGFVQRPTRRDSRGAAQAGSISIRALLQYAPTALKLIAVILTVITLIVGYRIAASASLFQVRHVDISGTSRTSAEEIESLTRRALARTGVWRADLSAISTALGRLPGVRRAVVTRVLPDRLRVRITERVPVAVVRTSAGRFLWVDDEGVALSEMKSTDSMPPFFIRGWNEEDSDDAGAGNIERVRKYLELAREWQTAGLLDRVSEVDLVDIRDIRVQLAGNDSLIEVRLGGEDLSQRLKSALEVLDRYKEAAHGSSITYVDSQGGRVILGFSSGNKISTGANPDATSKPTLAIATRVAPRATSENENNRSIGESVVTDANRKKPYRANATRSNNSDGVRIRVH